MKESEIKVGKRYTNGKAIREVGQMWKDDYGYGRLGVDYCRILPNGDYDWIESECFLSTFARWAKREVAGGNQGGVP